MPTLTEGARNAQFIVSEANGHRSRGIGLVTVPANTTFAAGTILGFDVSASRYVGPDFAYDSGDAENQALLYETLVNDTNAAIDHRVTLMLRDCEVTGADLTYETGLNAGQVTAVNTALASRGIIVR